MILTRRALFLLLLACPVLALSAWLPLLGWAALAWLLVCLSLILLDFRLAGLRQRFELERHHDSKLSLGADNSIQVLVRSLGRLPAEIWVRDEPPHAFRTNHTQLAGRVQPRETWQDSYTVQPLRRGDYQFGDLNLRWLAPLGLVIRQRRFPAAGPVKVYPNLLDVRRYDLLLRRNRLEEMGLRHTRQLGEGTEYERLREYLPDDDYRHISWKATARRSRPITVQFESERSQNVVAVLDTGRMMQSPVAEIAKLDYVVNAALLLSYVATGKGDKVGLLTFADRVDRFLSPRSGRGQFYRMLELLYSMETVPVEPDYQAAFAYLALKQHKRSLVIIFTDLTGGPSMSQLVGQVGLLARNHLPVVVTINDPAIQAASEQLPRDSDSAYQRSAAVHMLDERRLALDTLKRQGVLTLDIPANQLSLAVINQYLALKMQTRI